MSNLIANMVSGVMANFITMAIEYGCRNFDPKRLSEDKEPLETILQRAASRVAKHQMASQSDFIESLQIFLVSPDVDTLLRQIYSGRLAYCPNYEPDFLDPIQGEYPSFLEVVRSDFVVSLAAWLRCPVKEIDDLANDLFSDLLEACEFLLDKAIESNYLRGHEAKSTLRFTILSAELNCMKRSIDFLTQQHKPNIQEYNDFELHLRSEISAYHSFIIPPHFDVSQRIPLDDLYVMPEFKHSLFDDFLMNINRTVILGNPGAGKSTLANKIANMGSALYAKRGIAGRRVTPIIIGTRELAKAKDNSPCTIVNFIESLCKSNYELEPPDNAIEYFLLNGHLLVIFDGLDELLNTQSRQKIVNSIEAFARHYPSVPILVTSRVVGYEQAPLDNTMFAVHTINDFSESQVADYVHKWFSLQTNMRDLDNELTAENFLSESEYLQDLRSNPLMLSLMCNLYRGSGYIPQNRPDVYEKCTMMLFDRYWDKRRGISEEVRFEDRLRPTIMYLASWIFHNDSLQEGVAEDVLIKKISEYLWPSRFENKEQSLLAGKEFIRFCRGRAWIFTEVGTTKSGEGIYKFTHQTFLEYFTARYLAAEFETTVSLLEYLMPHIVNREWDVPAQLAIQIKYKERVSVGDSALTMLIEEAKKQPPSHSWPLLSFAMRCMEVIIPSPQTIHRLINSTLNLYISVEMMDRMGYDRNIDKTVLTPEHDSADMGKTEIYYRDIIDGDIEISDPSLDIFDNEIFLDGVGSGSGLLDLTNNDTSLGSMLDELDDLDVDAVCATESSGLSGLTSDDNTTSFENELDDSDSSGKGLALEIDSDLELESSGDSEHVLNNINMSGEGSESEMLKINKKDSVDLLKHLRTSLLKVSIENMPAVISATKNYFTENYSDDIILILFDIIDQLIAVESWKSHGLIIEFQQESLCSYKNKILKVAEEKFDACLFAIYHNWISVLTMVKWYGIQTLFMKLDIILNRFGNKSFSYYLLHRVIFDPDSIYKNPSLSVLFHWIGKSLINSDYPLEIKYTTDKVWIYIFTQMLQKTDIQSEGIRINKEILFSGLMIAIIQIELDDLSIDKILKSDIRWDLNFMECLRELLLARHAVIKCNNDSASISLLCTPLIQILKKNDLDEEKIDFFTRWACGDILLVSSR